MFDGHGGHLCAQFCSENLHIEIKKQLEDVLTGIEHSEDLNKTLKECLVSSFKKIDENYAKEFPKECKQCGTTACVALIIGNKLVIANVGDSRAVLCRRGAPIDLSVDHKARRQDEKDRIISQGGYIVHGRVLGRLAVSRAIGDFDCKNIDVPVK